jgi:hypothetical protein
MIGDAVPPAFQYTAFGRDLAVSPLKLVVGVLIIFFVSLELSERFSKVELDKKWLPLGGTISGFFGGLPWHTFPSVTGSFAIKPRSAGHLHVI